jgi:hypothetical protein
MLYSMKTTETTAAVPRVVDAHSLLHLQASPAAKACLAADWLDGVAIVQNPTLRLAATAYGVSLGSVARARRLTPEQRDAVKRGHRPLILPRIPMPVVAPATPRERLARIVAEVGIDGVLELLTAPETQLAA